MTQFVKMCMVLFIVLFTINMGLLSMDDTGLLGDDTYIITEGVDSSGIASIAYWQDLNKAFTDTLGSSTGISSSEDCEPSGILDFTCTIEVISSGVTAVTYLLTLFASIGLYLIASIPSVIGGYIIVLVKIADLLEPGSAGAIHGLFYTIGGILLLLFFFGMFFFVKSILQIFRPSGGG